ncbi:hypothetical protein BGZ96_012541 [Linnemannia gamsii]|uniref:Ubiquitin n=1 Tax=Linnemannia gamsii TaxID=64522 RepID=A0ABQ7JQW9_9FUNG|nr:hypothetical protein BGZ96_012541 [Linnemannia gamsii]
MSLTLDIIIAQSGPRNTLKVSYKTNEPISVLLERIRAVLRYDESSMDRQNLFINGMKLKDHNLSMEYYRIFGRILTYRTVRGNIKGEDRLLINIALPTGEHTTLLCQTESAGTSVEDVKHLIQEWAEISPVHQRLTYAGRQLEDSRSLRYYDITEGSTLRLTMTPPLRSHLTLLAGVVFEDGLGDSLGTRTVHFSNDAPKGRVVTNGANIECRCKCTPTHRVICQRSLGTLEVVKDTFFCPNCGKSDKISPIAVGFLKCKYRFHGIKASNGEQSTSGWEEVKAYNCYHLIGVDNSRTSWRRIVVETVDLHHKDICTICLQPLQLCETRICGHRFHVGCITKWKGPCPNCVYNQNLIADNAV